jgi:prepilin-type N-terminal cleavage/methylation domain-containing protein
MKYSKNKGFTIIEVIIVLVIGAIIMVAVFLVVPQLQRQSRESQKRQIAQRVLVAARQMYDSGGCPLMSFNVTPPTPPPPTPPPPVQWELKPGNSSGVTCSGIEAITGIIKNPEGGDYRFWTAASSGATRDYFYVFNNARCIGNGPAVGKGIAVYYGVAPFGTQTNPLGEPRCLSDD